MAITWGSSNVGGGSTVGGSTGGTGGYTRSVASGGRVLPASDTYTPPRRSGGGGGSNPTPAPTPQQQAPSQDYGSMVDLGGIPNMDEIFAPQEAYLGQVEAQLRADLPTYQKEAETNFNANKGQLDTSKNTTMMDITGQETTGQRKYEDAATAARRLFNEQQMGIGQRFGGSSSAGEAGRAILGQEQQRQLGQNQRSNIDFQAQVGRQRQAVEDSYKSSLLGLEQQKQTALVAIQRDFQAKLMEIANNRAQLASAKAQARVQAVMDLRNKTFAVQMQNMQFKQALDAQLAQSQQTMGSVGTAFGGARSNTSALQQNFQPSSGDRLNMDFGSNQQTNNPYTGQIANTRKKDEFGGLTSSPFMNNGNMTPLNY